MVATMTMLRWIAVMVVGLLMAGGIGAAQTPTPALPPGITFTARASTQRVVLGDTFEYIIQLGGNLQPDEIRYPSLSALAGISLQSGPEIGTNMVFVDGRSEVSRTWRFVLSTSQIGRFEIPAARIKLRGQWYESAPVTVEVVDVPESAAGLAGVISARSRNPAVTDQLRDKYFALAELPTEIYEGQAVPVQVYIYRDESMPGFLQWEQLPDTTGTDFLMPRVDNRDQGRTMLNWSRVRLGDRQFVRTLLYTVYVVPTRSGRLTLNPPTTRLYFALQRRTSNPFDDFFAGARSNMVDADARIRPMEVDVRPLPPRNPDTLAQLVGDVITSVTTDRTELPQRELVTLKLSLAGEGFLELIGRPTLPDLPGLNLVDAKSTSFSVIEGGRLQSQRVFEYTYQAVEAGTVTIPGLAFDVFDPRDKVQRVVQSDPIVLTVRSSSTGSILLGGAAPAGGAATVRPGTGRVLGRDIAYIDTTPLTAAAVAGGPPFFMRPWFWVLQVALLAGSVGWGLRQRWAMNRRESAADRARRATRQVRQALEAARRSMADAPRDGFYATLANGMLDFAAAQLGRSARGLTLEELDAELVRRGAAEDFRADLGRFLGKCQSIRYSPAPDTPAARQEAIEAAEAILARWSLPR